MIATGEQHSVRDFVELPRRASSACRSSGRATGVDEQGVDAETRTASVVQDRSALLPARPKSIRCSAMRARRGTKLGWRAETSFEDAGRGNGATADLETRASATRWSRAKGSRRYQLP